MTPVVYNKSKGYSYMLLFSLGINPLNLPQTLDSGIYTNMYPHQRSRINANFEVVDKAAPQITYVPEGCNNNVRVL